MRWIRQHIRPATWLAFAALVVHLVMTFGHVHAEWFSAPPAARTAITAAWLHVPSKAGGAGKPSQPYRGDNYCAICAGVSLLGTLVPPVSQSLVPPRVIVHIYELSLTDAATPGELRSSSQARAPPSA